MATLYFFLRTLITVRESLFTIGIVFCGVRRIKSCHGYRRIDLLRLFHDVTNVSKHAVHHTIALLESLWMLLLVAIEGLGCQNRRSNTCCTKTVYLTHHLG